MNAEAIGGGQKRCTRCGKTKNFAEFSRDPEMRHGLSSSCRECKRSVTKKYASLYRKAISDSELTRMADKNRPASAVRP